MFNKIKKSRIIWFDFGLVDIETDILNIKHKTKPERQ